MLTSLLWWRLDWGQCSALGISHSCVQAPSTPPSQRTPSLSKTPFLSTGKNGAWAYGTIVKVVELCPITQRCHLGLKTMLFRIPSEQSDGWSFGHATDSNVQPALRAGTGKCCNFKARAQIQESIACVVFHDVASILFTDGSGVCEHGQMKFREISACWHVITPRFSGNLSVVDSLHELWSLSMGLGDRRSETNSSWGPTALSVKCL